MANYPDDPLFGKQLFQGAASQAMALKLQSKAIEMQLQKEKEMFDYQRFTPDQMGLLQNMLQVPEEQRVPNTQPLHPSQAGPFVNLQRANVAADARMHELDTVRVKTERIGNQVKLLKFNRKGDLLEDKSIGFNPEFVKQVAAIDTEWAPAHTIIDEMDKAINVLNAPGSVLNSFPAGVKTRLSVLVQNNVPEAIAITKAKRAFALWLTAAVSGKQMTEREQVAMETLLPNPEDTLENAKSKLYLLSSMIASKQQAAYEAYGIEGVKSKPKKDPSKMSDEELKELLGL